MVLENILKEKQGDTYNFELVSPLVDALNGMRIEMEWQFWESLRERLTGRKETRAWCLERLAIDGALEVMHVEGGIASVGNGHRARPEMIAMR